jgi:flagellar motor switch protein FliN/FliY
MSRLLTPEEIAALRGEAPYVPAPRERYHVVVDAGHADLTHEELNALRAGDVLPLTRAALSPVEVVANGTTVAYGELIVMEGRAAVRVIALAGTDRRSHR